MPPFLPPEILGMILSFIFDIESLLALRLVNKVWRDAVDYSVRKPLYVDLLNKNLVRFYDATKLEENFRNQVRTLIWNLPDRPIWNCFSISDPLSQDLEGLSGSNRLQLLMTMVVNMRIFEGRDFFFPNLTHLAIHFRPPPIFDTTCLCSPAMKGYHLKDVFSKLIMGLDGFHGLSELSLLNIPIEFSLPFWISPANVDQWLPVGRIMREFGLKSLRMSYLAPKIWPYRNDDRARAPSARANHLLICTVKDTLRHLSLSNWGFYMKNSPGYLADELHLPHLQSLELRSCGFTSSQTLEWILSHSDTLRSLKFDDCAIIYSMELAPGSRADYLLDDINLGVEGGRVYQLYKLLWAAWFQRLARGLPHLQQFDFGSSRVRAPGERGPKFKSETLVGPRFGHTTDFLFGLFPDRYLEMKDGANEYPWVLRLISKLRKFEDRPVADEADISALRQLLAVTGQVVQENDTSNHAAKVVDLMGVIER
ncbi:uncharacterized protein N7473_005097 [Penicillium subrubescens]|uniref:F-box domain-containing protein n=1 Tax=Penicillium subrubescens TaxID=1316194 RepID=A0A1Q5UDK3_9EURO|nr:uncharacterized protein N7473_005097 [Penicillium subrubescens]KAJ5901027.1 hypothetical protein N7473_005097 [Penicillium subrubescens]OKP10545.1 hypothetical protein PENSUB_3848 [Penicillium subrubescens]